MHRYHSGKIRTPFITGLPRISQPENVQASLSSDQEKIPELLERVQTHR